MSTVAVQNDLIRARASLQRLRDAKILHGYIEAHSGSTVQFRVGTPLPVLPGDRFSFRATCLRGDLMFEAVLFDELEIVGTTERRLSLKVDGSVAMLPASGEPRYRSDPWRVDLIDLGISGRVADISPNGLGMMLPVGLNRGETITVEVESSAGIVRVRGEIRYCRQVSEHQFRVGLLLSNMDRVTRARWNGLVVRG